MKLPEHRVEELDPLLRSFCFVIPKARAAAPLLWVSHPDPSLANQADRAAAALRREFVARNELLHVPRVRTQLFFPDKRLIQYDCGKLQVHGGGGGGVCVCGRVG